MPRLRNEVAIHLEKARDSAFLAVETYNRPRTLFRSGGYIVLMCIAWTALLHAIFFNRHKRPFYRKKNNRRHYEIVDGDKKAWELSECLAEFWGNDHPASRTNLEFFIKLRNKIEHRSMPGLDLDIFGECQALLFNFEDRLVTEFGDKFALNESLSLALQFSCFRNDAQQASIRKLHKRLARDIKAYIDSFRSSLSTEQLQDMQFSYKVFLFPKPANRERGADLAVEFVKYDPHNPEEMARINGAVALIKPPTTTVSQSAGAATGDVRGVPVRIVTDPNAIAVRAIDFDTTHPYRRMDLIKRVKELLPEGMSVTTFDLDAVRYAFRIVEREDYYHKSKFGSVQYSDAYAQWIAQSYISDLELFRKARETYQGRALA